MPSKNPKAVSYRVSQWESGQPLSFSWFYTATQEARREYQTCEIDSRRISLRLDMQFDVQDKLVSGELVGWGFREGAPAHESPILIPSHLFPRGGNDTATIDWDVSALRSAGFSFVRIRVTKPARIRRQRRKMEPPPAPRASSAPAPVELTPVKEKGRPRVDGPLRAVVRSLFDAGQLKDKSRKEQIEVIRSAARIAHPTLFLRETQPSRDKIFAALRAEGLISPK